MKKVFTEIRISHKTADEKKEYEFKLSESLRRAGYKSRTEFIKEKIRELVNQEV